MWLHSQQRYDWGLWEMFELGKVRKDAGMCKGSV